MAKFLMKVEAVPVIVELVVAEDIFWNGSKTAGMLSKDEGTVACTRPTSVVYPPEEEW